jgi:methylthioribose-1-phosphate isomerase
MKVGGQHFRTIWLKPEDECVVQLIDQRFLPHRFTIEEVSTVEQMVTAIREMHVRGAGLIGASAGYGMYLATLKATERPGVAGFNQDLASAAAQLKATRPTAVNLSWAVERQLKNVAEGKTAEEKIALALRTALPNDRAAWIESNSADCANESRQADQRAHALQRGVARIC